MITELSKTVPALTDKRAFGQAVGDELLKRNGKKPDYSHSEIAEVLIDLGLDGCELWAHALFGTADSFRAAAAASKSAADYAQMKAEMFGAMTDGASASWFDLDMSWLDWPDINFGDIFSCFDF